MLLEFAKQSLMVLLYFFNWWNKSILKQIFAFYQIHIIDRYIFRYIDLNRSITTQHKLHKFTNLKFINYLNKLWINYIIMVNEKSEWLFCLDSNSSLINAANMLIEYNEAWLKKYWRFSTLLSCVKLISSCFSIVENALIRSSLYLGHSKMRKHPFLNL